MWKSTILGKTIGGPRLTAFVLPRLFTEILSDAGFRIGHNVYRGGYAEVTEWQNHGEVIRSLAVPGHIDSYNPATLHVLV